MLRARRIPISVMVSIIFLISTAFWVTHIRAGTLEFDGVPVDITTSTSEDLVIVPGEGGNTQIGDGTGSNTNATSNDDLHVTGGIEVDGVTYSNSGIVSGSNIISDTDSIDSLGTSTVAWANIYVDAIKTVSGTNLTLLPTAAYTIIGDAGTPGYASGNDDLFVSGILEVDGVLYADDDLLVGSSDLFVDNSLGRVAIGNTAPQGLLDVGTNPGVGLIVTTAGKVGIGTTAPVVGLSVGTGVMANTSPTPGNDLYVTGNMEVDGSVWLGDAAADNLTVAGSLVATNLEYSGNLLPDTDDTHDIGSATAQWKDLYIDGTANIDDLAADAGAVTGNLTVGTLTDGTLSITDGNITSAVNITATKQIQAGTFTDGTLTIDAGDIAGVGDVSLDTITSDGSSIVVGQGSTSTITLTDNTSIAIALGSDVGDDFTIDTSGFVYEGDNDRVGIGTASPGSILEVKNLTSGTSPTSFKIIAGTTSADNFALQIQGSDEADTLVVLDSGLVGIGTTAPVVGLSVGTGVMANTSPTPGNDLYVTGNMEVDGSVWLGDATADTLTVQGTLSAANLEYSGNLVPDVDDTHDIGTAAAQWKDLYIDGTANIDDLAADAGAVTGNLTVGTLTDGTLSITDGNITSAVNITASKQIQGGTLTDGTLTIDAGDIGSALNITASKQIQAGTFTDGTLIIDAGDIGSALNITASKQIQGGTLTDGTLTIDAGDIASALNITASKQIQGGTLTDGTLTIDAGDIGSALNITASKQIQGGTLTDGTLTIDAGDIAGVGDVSLDTITSDGASIVVGQGDENTYTQTGGTTHAFALGSDAGDDFTIDTSGFVYEGDSNRVGIGTTAPGSILSVHSDSAANVEIREYSNSAFAPTAFFYKARGTEAASTIVQDDDNLAMIRVMGYDGTAFEEISRIAADIDGTPGEDDMPGRLAFYTTPDGSVTPQERMRITNAGDVGIGNTGPQGLLDVGTNPGVGLIVTTAGKVGVGTTAPAAGITVGAGTNNNATGADDLYVTGKLEVDGSAWLGDAAADNLTVTGSLVATNLEYSGNLVPDADDTHDLGSASAEWQDLYLDGTANIDNLAADAGAVTGNLTVGTLTDGTLSITDGNVTSASNITASKQIQGGTLTDGTLTIDAGDIAGVGDVSLDTITSDGSSIVVGQGSTSTITLTDNTSIAIALGSDAGDDFTIDSTGFVYEGDNNRVGIGTTGPQGLLDVGTNPGVGLIVTEGGRVGIGTTGPSEKLQVSGGILANTLADGTLTIQGGAIAAATNITATKQIQGGTLTDGTLLIQSGDITSASDITLSGTLSTGSLLVDGTNIAIGDYVPYTGATATVNLGGQELVTSDGISIGATGAPTEALEVTGNTIFETGDGGYVQIAEDSSGVGSSSPSEGLLRLGVCNDGTWESIFYDPSLGSKGKFVISAPLQVAASSPAITFYDPSDPTNTTKQKSIEYDASGANPVLDMGNSFKTYFVDPGSRPPAGKALILLGEDELTTANMDYESMDYSGGYDAGGGGGAESHGVFLGANVQPDQAGGFKGDLIQFQVMGMPRFMVGYQGNLILDSGNTWFSETDWRPIIETRQRWAGDGSNIRSGWRMTVDDAGSHVDSRLIECQVFDEYVGSGDTTPTDSSWDYFNQNVSDVFYVTKVGNGYFSGSVTATQFNGSISSTGANLTVGTGLATSASITFGTTTVDGTLTFNGDTNTFGVGNSKFMSTGPIQAGTLTDGTLSITGGNITAANSIATANLTASGTLTSGGLAVDTSTIYVNSGNNRVGIGTTAPGTALHMASGGLWVDGGQIRLGVDKAYLSYETNRLHTYVGGGTNANIATTILDSGLVGIGTTNPLVGLSVGTGVMANTSPTPGNDLYVTGNMEVDGSVWLGDAAADNLTVQGTLVATNLEYSGNLVPNADDSHDLGTAAAEWKDLYIDGTANIDDLAADAGAVSGNLTVGTLTDGTLSVTGGNITAASSIATANLTATGTLTSGGLAVDTSTIYVNSGDNRVGIGTTAPATSLDLVGTTYLRSLSGDTTKFIVIDYVGATDHRIYTEATSGTPGNLVLGTYPNGHTNQLVLEQANGYVGIGTSGPAGPFQVDISSTQTPIFVVTQTNQVGIGTTGPGALLEVKNLIVGTAPTSFKIIGGSTSAGNFALQVQDFAGADKLVVLDTGKVGIGTTGPVVGLSVGTGVMANTSPTPGNDLYVTGNMEVDGSVWLGDAAADNLTVQGTLVATNLEYSGNLVPNADDSHDLGTAAAEWKDLYIDGTANIDDLAADAGAVSGNLTVGTLTDGTLSITGGNITAAANITATGTLTSGGLAVDTSTIYVDSGNNRVGIGTTAPSRQLEIGDGLNSGVDGYVRFNGYSASGKYGEIYYDGDNFYIDNSYTAGAEITIKYGGQVGVGGNPGDAKFYVNGNVGIGTTGPAVDLHVIGDARIERAGSGVQLSLKSTTDGDSTVSFQNSAGTSEGYVKYDFGSDFMAFRTNQNERMRIDNSGNVGIGTTSISDKLHILESANHEVIIGRGVTSGGPTDADAYGPSIRLSRDSDGGIVHKIYSYDTSGDALNNLAFDTRSDFVFLGNGVERVRIKEAGNVGIGTTNPSAKLEVADTGKKSFEVVPDTSYVSLKVNGVEVARMYE